MKLSIKTTEDWLTYDVAGYSIREGMLWLDVKVEPKSNLLMETTRIKIIPISRIISIQEIE